MGKQIFWGFINFLKKFFGSIANFFIKPGMREDGKFLNPKAMKKGPLIAIVVGMAMLFIYKNFIAPEAAMQMHNNFEKEITVKHGQGGVANINEIAELNELEMLRLREQEALEQAGLSGGGFGGSGDRVVIDPVTGEPISVGPLTPDRCQILIDRVVAGEELQGQEKTDLMECLSQNITGLSDLQKKAIEALMDPNSDLTDAERKLLQEVASGKITNDDDPRLDMARGLLSDDPLKKKAARMLINNPDLTPEERDKLLSFLRDELSPEEVEELKKGLLQKPVYGVDSGVSESSPDIQNVSTTEELRGLADEIARADKEIKDLEAEIASEEARFKELLDKMARGEELTPEEQRFFDAHRAKKARLKKLKEEQQRRKDRFAELSEKAKRELLESQALVKSTLGPGEFLESDSKLGVSQPLLVHVHVLHFFVHVNDMGSKNAVHVF